MVDCEEGLLDEQVVVGLDVGEAHWVFELLILQKVVVWPVLLLYVGVEVVDDVLEFVLEDLAELGVDVGTEVVEAVHEAADVAFEGPAASGFDEVEHEVFEGVAFEQFADVDDVVVVDQGGHDLEEGAEVGEFGTHFDCGAVAVFLFVLCYEFFYFVTDVLLRAFDHDVSIAVVLHDFEDLDLVVFEAAAVAVDEVSIEVEEFGFVETVLLLCFDVFADLFDEVEDGAFVVEHGFVVVVHFLEEVDAADVLLDVMDEFGDVALH